MNTPSPPYTPKAWLQPISEDAPCGPSLEYDPEYALLVAGLQPRGEAQYGEFIDGSTPPDWSEVERLCRSLMARTRDINLLVWLCRARVRTASALGLAQGLGMLADVLERWPQDVHPQPWIDGQADPAVRANSLAALCDPQGLLGDVRDIAVSGSGMRLLVRDVERAFSPARGLDTPEMAAIRQQLDELRLRAEGNTGATLRLLGQAACSAQRIHQWGALQLQQDAPDLLHLLRVLRPFEPHADPVIKLKENTESQATALSTGGEHVRAYATSSAPGDATQSRASVLRSIQASRKWFEINEPSSPVAILLKQAERMVGQHFCAVADAIPLDLLRKWDAQDSDPVSDRGEGERS